MMTAPKCYNCLAELFRDKFLVSALITTFTFEVDILFFMVVS